MENAPTTIRDAWQLFSEAHGSEHPLRNEADLRDAIHANGLEWGRDDEKWQRFWEMLFESEQGQEWLYSEAPPDFNPLMENK